MKNSVPFSGFATSFIVTNSGSAETAEFLVRVFLNLLRRFVILGLRLEAHLNWLISNKRESWANKTAERKHLLREYESIIKPMYIKNPIWTLKNDEWKERNEMNTWIYEWGNRCSLLEFLDLHYHHSLKAFSLELDLPMIFSFEIQIVV